MSRRSRVVAALSSAVMVMVYVVTGVLHVIDIPGSCEAVPGSHGGTRHCLLIKPTPTPGDEPTRGRRQAAGPTTRPRPAVAVGAPVVFRPTEPTTPDRRPTTDP